MLAVFAMAAATVDLPPLTLTVRSAPTIAAIVVHDALREAAAIWQPSGVSVVWTTSDDEDDALDAEQSRDSGSMPGGIVLSVEFDDGTTAVKDYAAAIGSIQFDEHGAVPDIHLSYASALWLLRDVYGDGAVNTMTNVARRTYLSRALGRALAHEIGHYVLASRAHTPHGLMKARHLAGELFGPSRRVFEITETQRCEAMSRLRDREDFARR
jgi:hypothetical protein